MMQSNNEKMSDEPPHEIVRAPLSSKNEILLPWKTAPVQKKVQKRVFGPIVWEDIHLLANSLDDVPSETKQDSFLTYLKSVGDLLPCGECCHHFTAYLLRVPLEKPFGRAGASRYVNTFHNVVNRRLGENKYQFPYSEDQEKYEDQLTYSTAKVIYVDHKGEAVIDQARENDVEKQLEVYHKSLSKPEVMASVVYSQMTTLIVSVMLIYVVMKTWWKNRNQILNSSIV
jgi:hypothetical protein